MNPKTVKLIRKYAKLRGLDYHRCKATFEMSTRTEQDKFKMEMIGAFVNPKPGLIRVRK